LPGHETEPRGKVASIHTDGWSGYAGLTATGSKHQVTVISAEPDTAHEVMPLGGS
jgi:hypothetical protein